MENPTHYPASFGKCSIEEDTGDTSCETGGPLVVSYKSNWDWEDNKYINPFEIPKYNPSAPETFIPTDDGEYHFPSENYQSCDSINKRESTTIPCPASVQLPFFNWISFIVSFIAIELISFLYFNRKIKEKR